MGNKSGGNFIKATIGLLGIFLLIIFFWMCFSHPLNDGGVRNLVDIRYSSDQPIAQLINMGTHCDLEQEFILDENAKIQIYAVGEFIYNLANANREFFFLGDDIHLYFMNNNRNTQEQFHINWNDKSDLKNGTSNFIWKAKETTSSNIKLYTVEIQIPWKSISKMDMTPLLFNVVIGDNDDFYKQKAKLAWKKTNPIVQGLQSYGRIKFAGRVDSSCLNSGMGSPIIDGRDEKMWLKYPSSELKHVIMGNIKDKYDLSASMQSCWDESNMYFLIKVQDDIHRVVNSRKIRDLDIFADFGWIENSSGKVIWKMEAANSRHAGGAFKNQSVDTTIFLNKGKYRLKFKSDESHAFNDWDDNPPTTTFYGIKLYRFKRDEK